jgi:HlyD family type I secretion membrane fusion protein
VVNDVNVIQHPSGGIVKKILVRDGDKVTRGQPLIELEDAHVSASDRVLALQWDAQIAKGARLKAEQKLADHIDFPADLLARGKSDAHVASILSSERSLFADRRHSYGDQLLQLGQEKTQLQQEISDSQLQEHAAEQSLALLRKQIATYRDLLDKQYIPQTQFDDLLRSEQDYMAHLAATDSQRAQTEERLHDLSLRIQGLKDGLAQSVVSDLQDSSYRQNDVAQQYGPAHDAATRLIVRSPIDGVVFNQRVNTLGEVIGGGVVLMEVIPSSPQFVVETTVQVQDIRQVSLGRLAELRFTAFNRRSSPYIPGHVIYISPDRVSEPGSSQPPGYIVRIAFDTEGIRKEFGMKLTSGMAVNVFIRGISRTILSYMMEPVTESLRQGMREP